VNIPASSAPVARKYLYDALNLALTPDPLSTKSSLLVCYDQPGPNQPDDIVSVGKVHRQIGVSAMVGDGGAGWLEENYTVEVLVDVFRGGDSAPAAYNRASGLVDAIVAVVRADLSLGGAVLRAKPMSDLTEVEWDDDHGGQRATSTLEVSCYQRI
jgi:hypothetical protein